MGKGTKPVVHGRKTEDRRRKTGVRTPFQGRRHPTRVPCGPQECSFSAYGHPVRPEPPSVFRPPPSSPLPPGPKKFIFRPMTQKPNLPEILAPAGDADSFLAAIAAGADAVYCGLKHFSARMEAQNFSIAELGSLADMAREKGKKTYIALNTLIKPGEDIKAASLLPRLEKEVRPEGIIASDLSLP